MITCPCYLHHHPPMPLSSAGPCICECDHEPDEERWAARPNRRVEFPPGTRVLRHGDNVPGSVVEQPPGDRVVVWWDNGVRSRHSIRQLRRSDQ